MDFNKILLGGGGIVVKQIWISILSMIEQKRRHSDVINISNY